MGSLWSITNINTYMRKALHEALLTVQLLHLQLISFIGDAQYVIIQVLDEEPCLAYCSPILEDIGLLQRTPCLGVFWKRRSFNLVAHELSFFAKSNSPFNSSRSSPSNLLLSISVGQVQLFTVSFPLEKKVMCEMIL